LRNDYELECFEYELPSGGIDLDFFSIQASDYFESDSKSYIHDDYIKYRIEDMTLSDFDEDMECYYSTFNMAA
jgi:hypothetical protein